MQKRYPVVLLLAVTMIWSLAWSNLSSAQTQDDERTATVENLAPRAAKVLENQMTEKGNKRIPPILRQESKCILVFPAVVKAGFIVAVKGGQGLGSCRDAGDGEWGPPAVFNITAGSVGLQAGIQSASVILLVTNQVGLKALLQSKVSFGPGLELAAGPVGGSAEMKTQQPFLSYARTRGLFAGVDLEGAVLTFGAEANEEVYGKSIGAQELLLNEHEVPESLRIFHTTLKKFAP